MPDLEIGIKGGDTGEPLNLEKRLKVVKEIVRKDSVILDCGCGAGEYIPGLLTVTNDVFGIEYNQEKVSKFRKANPELNNILQGDIEKMPYKSDFFDFVILNEVLEHIPNDKGGLQEIQRVLKPGGTLIIFSPNRIYPFETHGVYWKRSGKFFSHAMPFVPYIPQALGQTVFTYWARNYFPLELRNLLQGLGFTIQRHFYITQTFEGIGKNEFLKPIRKYLRAVFSLIEKIPVLRVPFCVSQVIVSVK